VSDLDKIIDNITILKMAAVCRRGFSNFENFRIWPSLLSDSASSYKISRKPDKLLCRSS